MTRLPTERALDSTLSLWSEGYRFISNRCDQHRSDLFQARLLLEPTICMRGEQAARLFYDTGRFVRAGAAPSRVQNTLFGHGGVQGLDGAAHRHRKAMFLSLMDPPAVQRLTGQLTARWRSALPRWQTAGRVRLFSAVREVLGRAVCEWAAVPLAESDVARRVGDLSAMIDGAASVGPRYWRAKRARRRAEEWIGALVAGVRETTRSSAKHEVLPAIALHRDLEGNLLDPAVAAVEVLNLLRPTLAIGRYAVFAAVALHQHPHTAERLRAGELDSESFVHEVRRFYPFFPFTGARVRDDFEWQGVPFPRHRRVLLDLYGTNHDARLWPSPESFRPERFQSWDGNPFTLIPQGGGDHATNHRCAGEWVTIALLRETVRLLLEEMRYEVPPQDLGIDLSTIPAAPASGFIIERIRGVG